MKKSIIFGIIGLAAGVASSYGQGAIWLDNYASSGPQITLSGGSLVPTGFTAGLYYGPANTDISGSIASDPTGFADPLSLDASFTLATGTGATAAFYGDGFFSATASFLIQPTAGTVSVPQDSFTIMVVVYNGSTYDDSTIRGHSAAFYVEDSAVNVADGSDLGGSGLQSFAVYSVPEPATLALAGLGGLGMLMAMRRKKA